MQDLSPIESFTERTPNMPLKGLFVLGQSDFHLIYGPEERARIAELVDIYAPPQTPESVKNNPKILADADVIFSGWNMCRIDQAFLDAAPQLKVIFYGAGLASHIATPEAIARSVAVTTAVEANSIPVAEYTLATTLFSLKHGWSLSRRTRSERVYPDRNGAPGAFESTVGIVSLGAIGRHVVSLLRPFDVKVIAHDPYVTDAQADVLGVELVSLDEVFQRSDVVSLHMPELSETIGMITGRHISAMKHGATLINTSRGALIREEEMLDVLEKRPDLQAVLDTVAVEPPAKHSRLYSLDNVMLTPHIAGSVGNECRRMGSFMVHELERYVQGKALQRQVTREVALNWSHRSTHNGRLESKSVQSPHLVITLPGRRPAAVNSQ